MRLRHRVLFALLVYVTLDLSMPAMPGAFVFDPAESVEGARTTTRGRAAMDIVQGPVPTPTFLLPATPHLETVDRARPVRGVGGPTPEVVIHLPRATLSSAPGSEDPQ